MKSSKPPKSKPPRMKKTPREGRAVMTRILKRMAAEVSKKHPEFGKHKKFTPEAAPFLRSLMITKLPKGKDRNFVMRQRRVGLREIFNHKYVTRKELAHVLWAADLNTIGVVRALADHKKTNKKNFPVFVEALGRYGHDCLGAVIDEESVNENNVLEETKKVWEERMEMLRKWRIVDRFDDEI